MTLADQQARYDRDLRAGLEFEDYVTDVLYRHGIPVVGFSSRRYQDRGENKAGFEIKYDREFGRTRNLFIETAERPHTAAPMKPAGVNDERNWIFVIGDRSILFLFARTTLVRAQKARRYREIQNPTAVGFLLPEHDARVLAAKVIEIEANGASPTPIRPAWDPSLGEVAPDQEPGR